MNTNPKMSSFNNDDLIAEVLYRAKFDNNFYNTICQDLKTLSNIL